MKLLKLIATASIIAIGMGSFINSAGASDAQTPVLASMQPTLINNAPLSTALFSSKEILSIASTSDNSVIAYVEKGSNAISVKSVVGSDAFYEEIGNAHWCAPNASPLSEQIKSLQISEDGNSIAFISKANSVQCAAKMEERIEGAWLAYVAKRTAPGAPWVYQLLSTSSSSTVAAEANQLALTKDGSKAIFTSNSDQLYPGDSNRNGDVFVKEINTDRTTLISVGAGGWQANSSPGKIAVSQNGRYVAWSADYKDGDSQVYPEVTEAVSNILLADIGDDGIELDEIQVKKIPLGSVPLTPSSGRIAELIGFLEDEEGPSVAFRLKNSASVNFHSISRNLNYSASIGAGAKISDDGEKIWDSTKVYFMEEQKERLISNDLKVKALNIPLVNSNRVYTNTQYQGSYESELSNPEDATSFISTPQNFQDFEWANADPSNIIPSEVERGRLNEQVVWLASLNGQLGKLIHQKKYERGDKDVTKPSSTISEASLPADRRTTVLDIDDLETLRAETEATLTSAREKKELIDLALTAAACRNPGQWCGATKAAATSEISSAVLDVMINKIAGKFPLVQAFDLAYNSANGACPGPLEQIVNYSAAAAAETHIGAIRSNGEAASWPVTQNILEDYYGIDRPGCWDQVGLDADTLLDAAGGFAEGLGGKWKGLGASITAVQISVNSM